MPRDVFYVWELVMSELGYLTANLVSGAQTSVHDVVDPVSHLIPEQFLSHYPRCYRISGLELLI